MSDDRVNELEKAISTGSSSDPEVESLARLGDELKEEYAADVRPNPGARALFKSGVAARGHRSRLPGALVPVAAGLALLLITVGVLGRTAVPGEALYPVRDALEKVGLANRPVEFVDGHIRTADRLIERAESLDNDQFDRAQALAVDALVYLDEAGEALDELSAEQREERADEIADLSEDARDVYADAEEERVEAATGGEERDEGGSGPGSGGDDPDEDSSGPGSGDDDPDDDSSGPGSGDDDPDDDSSGPGSGDDDRDDSSGPGSGDDSSGSSGSGSSGSGSSGSGSSGSGSDD